MYVISMFCFRYKYQKSWTVSGYCQPLCYTFWRFCSSWQSVPVLLYRHLKKYFALWRKAWWVLCACVYAGKRFLQYYKGKETKYLLICCQYLTDWLTGTLIHPQTEDVRCHCVGPTYYACCDSLFWTYIFQYLNCIWMVVHSIWFSMLIFCFSVNVAVLDAVRLNFFFVCLCR